MDSQNEIKSSLEFYDLIFQIDSILSLKTGWELKFSEKGLKTYNEYKNLNSTVIGVIGNGNKGKSFILQRISGMPMISGYSVKTEGLSLKYPNNIKKNIICLDTAGLETPILETNEYKLSAGKSEKEINEMISTLSLDKQLTEFFLQNFVIKYSNILIAVVGQLSYSDQKLLNRIKKDCKNKELFIVHNLNNLHSIEEVKDYIENTLKTSLTFKLREETFIELNQRNEDKGKDDQVQIYYVEEELIQQKKDENTDNPNDTTDKHRIVHLVIAFEGSVAGKYYNQKAYDFLKMKCETHVSKRKFEVIKKVKSLLFYLSKDIMEEPINKMEDIENDEKVIRLRDKKTILLKKCFVNELGYSNFYGRSFTPKYSYYIDESKNHFIISFEFNGETSEFTKTYSNLYGNHIIKVLGTKKKDEIKSKYGMTTKESGNFEIDIRVQASSVLLKGKEPIEQKFQNGIVKLIYELQDTQLNEDQEINFDEDTNEENNKEK